MGMRGAVGRGAPDFGYAQFTHASDNIAMPSGRFSFFLSFQL